MLSTTPCFYNHSSAEEQCRFTSWFERSPALRKFLSDTFIMFSYLTSFSVFCLYSFSFFIICLLLNFYYLFKIFFSSFSYSDYYLTLKIIIASDVGLKDIKETIYKKIYAENLSFIEQRIMNTKAVNKFRRKTNKIMTKPQTYLKYIVANRNSQPSIR